ncbi:hypothetical protein [Paracoccus tegillarcae]|uniref:Uncharacterized protein n=1 Tax=Paracoccus tegillarcae TaxID=1529068 RepID=A0A2K9EWY0_9RHOB|nr:hypothetical protein [Paracoccus tegillarcae]AUH32562.1 hypothetical protein CUV01_03455 [Paracoccus tegillarcae]
MAIHSVGDQARAFVLQNQTAHLRNSLNVLTDELATGLVADKAGRLGGNTTQLHHFESQIAILNQYKSSGQEAANIAEATQQVLAALHSDAAGFAADALATRPATNTTAVSLRASQAQALFGAAVARLNTNVAGLHLFAGQATDTPALAGAEAILTELQAVTAGMSTAADVETAIIDWFDAAPGGGGYLDFAYNGTIGEPRLAQIAEERVISFSTSGATPAIRNLLKGLAVAALSNAPTLAAADTERLSMVDRAGALLRSNETAVLDEMGRVGLLQSLAERFGTEHSNALAVAEIGRSNLITADPFLTATALQQVQVQMETLYTLTARLSGLNLVDYLR